MGRWFPGWLVAAVGLAAHRSWAADHRVPVMVSEAIFPPEARHNHASCVVEAPDGTLFAAWFHGSGERQ
ncbi:MAG: sialidase, partial [Verrucomicrobia bacterium]|nr:sialidase [Verrucomicrobiota bacterium]